MKNKTEQMKRKMDSYLINTNCSWESEANLFSFFSSNCKCSMGKNSEVEITQLDDDDVTTNRNIKNGSHDCEERRILLIPVVNENGKMDELLIDNPNIMTSLDCLDIDAFTNGDAKVSRKKSRKSQNNGLKSFSCTECEKTFTRKQNLQKHLLIHSGEKPFPCNHCEKRFARKHHLKKHIEGTHKDIRSKSDTLLDSSIESLDLDFDETEICRDDSNEDKGDDGGDNNKGDNVNSSSKPTKQTKTYSCDICDLDTFSSKSAVKEHKTSCHKDNKPFICFKCDKKFVRKYSLKRHSESFH